MSQFESKIQFKGLRNDVGQKFVPNDYFFNVANVNYDQIIGADKILAPSVKVNLSTSNSIDGIFEFKYTDSNNIPQTIDVFVSGGNFYKNVTTDYQLVATGFSQGKCDFCVQNDRLFIVNGIDYPKIYDGQYVWEMGAPRASLSSAAGDLTGYYYYAMTYVTSGGEEVLGTVSNRVLASNQVISLDIPIGYDGTTSRKIYRTDSGGTALKLLATVADNTTTAYSDNNNGTLGAPIPATNNPCPKPFFIEVANGQLIGCVTTQYPTQLWVGDPEVEVWDLSNFLSISAVGNDNTPLVGMEQDYGLIVIASQKNIYTLDISGDSPVVTLTRANVGCLNGYSMVKVPSNGEFEGGIMFLSNLKDIRLFNGNFAQPIATSLDNLKTDNLSQPIRPTMVQYVSAQSNINSTFWDYKYHIIIDDILLTFDIRTQAWGLISIVTDTYAPSYNCFGLIGSNLYAGQFQSGMVEVFYSSLLYRGEEFSAFIQSPQFVVSDNVKKILEFYFYFVSSSNVTVNVQVTTDGDYKGSINQEISLSGGAYSQSNFSDSFYQTDENNEDYRCVHVYRPARWFEFKITSNEGPFYFRGFKVTYDTPTNKEVAIRR